MLLETAIKEEKHDDVLNELEKYLQKDPPFPEQNLLLFNKLVALIKLNNFERAQEFLKIHIQTFQQHPLFPLLSNYILYLKENYNQIVIQLEKLEQPAKTFEVNLLLVQSLAKQEKYERAFDLYHDLYHNPKCAEYELQEELSINFLYVSILLILTKGEDLKALPQFKKLTQLLPEMFKHWLAKAEQRETLINFVLLLIVLDQSKIFSLDEVLGKDFDYIKEGKKIIEKIQQNIEKEDGTKISNESLDFLNFEGVKFDDFLTLFILRTFFMKKE